MIRDSVTLTAGNAGKVSSILQIPDNPFACSVLAHGAGAGMHHPFMDAVAEGLGARGMATLRYQFPFMERGSRRPDSAAVAQSLSGKFMRLYKAFAS